ncbi:chemotaxis protein CheD [Mesorhizobium soli]|uniref:Probable chemoreceptor glutamine deamidase CheD n=1 Tax=Pseudaminobacter soli (ex Li et al. 2025) TaxID=1295366 RepID=A0A2P7RIV1_9HYPH|nr:chemotaxis protein CheD [Mesorhizobium soli]
MRGEFYVVDRSEVVLTTLLGSCVAACLRDPQARVGGMNHFLLPGTLGAARQDAERYGVHLMELLVNGLLARGAQRQRLEAKLFGGARTLEGLSDIGALNAEFAKGFLRHEGIAVVGGDLGGERGRRIEYWPVSGRARQALLKGDPGLAAPAPPPPPSGAVEFF